MTRTEENSQEAIQYLFGELDDAQRDALEERLFADEDYSLHLDAVEHDLIDEYVRGEMSAGNRRRFEEKYLISEARREKVRVAGILQKEVFVAEEIDAPEASAPEISFWQSLTELFRAPTLAWAGGLAAILLLILAGWLLLGQDGKDEFVSNRATVSPTPAPTSQKSPDAIPPDNNRASDNKPPANNRNKPPETNSAPANNEAVRPEKRETVSPAPPRVFAVTLLPVTRSGERPTLNIPPKTETVNLRVVHDNAQSFARYRAEIRDRNGDLIWSREIPVTEKTLTRPLRLNVRRAALADGAYELTLSGMTADNRLEEIKFYNFTVKTK